MKLRIFALSVVAFFILASIPVPVEGANPVDMRIRILGEPFFSDTKIVAGVIHNVTVNLTIPSNDIDILLYTNESALLANPEIRNTYHWTYSGGIWTDALYDNFIEDTSGVYGLTYAFHIGLNANASVGNWVMSVKVDGQEEVNRTVSVAEPVKGLGTKGPSQFHVNLEPYRTGFWNSWNTETPENSTAVRFGNTGNVPLEIEIEYDLYDSHFTTTNDTGILHVGEWRYAYLSFQADPWSPGQFKVKGLIKGSPVNVMTSPATVSFEQAVGTDINVNVSVARPGYEIFQIPGFVVQYKARVTANYTDVVRMDMYFTGYNTAALTPEPIDVSLDEMKLEGTLVSEPVQISVNNLTETHMVLLVNLTESPAEGKPSMLAYMNYNIENPNTGDNGHFTTTFVVLAKEISKENEDFGLGPLNIYSLSFIILAIIIIIAFIIQYRRKLFEQRLREEEKKKSQKNRKSKRRKRIQ